MSSQRGGRRISSNMLKTSAHLPTLHVVNISYKWDCYRRNKAHRADINMSCSDVTSMILLVVIVPKSDTVPISDSRMLGM
jgi:hypothetical protein